MSAKKYNGCILIILVLLLLFCLAHETWAAPMFNEVTFNPSGTEHEGECIEIYNNGNIPINMENYQVINQSGFVYIFPPFTLEIDSYVILHIGSGIDTMEHLYAGETDEKLSNMGEDLLLIDNSGNFIDYIAYGTGSMINSCPTSLSWTNNIEITGINEGESIGVYPNGIDEDRGDLWHIFKPGIPCQAGSNGQQIEPVFIFDSISPDISSRCSDIGVIVSVENPDPITSIVDVQMIVTIPDDYYFIASSPSGTYNQANHTIVFALDEIHSMSDRSVELHIQASCAAASGSTLSASATWYRYSGGSRQMMPTIISDAITLYDPDLSISMVEYPSGDETIWKEKEHHIEYMITVSNNESIQHPGIDVRLTLGTGLTLLSIKNDDYPPTTVRYSTENNIYTWTTDSISPMGSDIFYVKAKSNDCKNLLSTTEIIWGCADFPGTPECQSPKGDSVRVRCPLSYTIKNLLPAANGTLVNVCQEMDTNIEITNSDELAIDDASMVLTIPDSFYYVTSEPVGIYDPDTHTITFGNSAIGVIPGNSTKRISATLRPSCNANSLENIYPSITYGNGTQVMDLPASEDIPLGTPAISITMEDDNNRGSTTILAARGETVTFRLNVINSGDGALVNGADLLVTLGEGLTNRVFRDSSGKIFDPNGSGTQQNPYTWNTDLIADGNSTHYTIEVKIDSCTNLTNGANFRWGCEDTGTSAASCSVTNDSESSVKINLKTPSIEIAPDNFVVPWCEPATHSFMVNNTGTGSARDVIITLVGFDNTNLSVEDTANSAFRYNTYTNSLKLIKGHDTDGNNAFNDIESGSGFLAEFNIEVKDDACSAGGTGGNITYRLSYGDDCDMSYNAGTMVGSYSVAQKPLIMIAKSDVDYVDAGGQVSWTITVKNPSNQPISVPLIEDNFPDAGDTPNGYGNFTVVSPVTNADEMVFVQPGSILWFGQTIPANGSWQKTILLNAPTNTCAGGNTYTNKVSINSPSGSYDCKHCPIFDPDKPPPSASVNIYINNDREEVVLNAHDRIVEYINYNSNHLDMTHIKDKGESCAYTEDGLGTLLNKGGVKITAKINFNSSSSAPNSWSNPYGDGNNVIFRENLDGFLQIPQAINAGDSLATRLNLRVFYSDIDVTNHVADDIIDNGGNFTINLGDLDNSGAGVPSDGRLLQISYLLFAPDESAQSSPFNTTHTLIVSNSGCPCDDFNQGVQADITLSSANASITKTTGNKTFMDTCETATFRFNINAAELWSMYDIIFEVDLDTDKDGIPNYKWIEGAASEAFGGFLDEGNVPVTWKRPMENGSILSWNFGDLRANGYIQLDLKKSCEDTDASVSAIVYSHTNCTNQDDSLIHSDNPSNSSWRPLLTRQGKMDIVLTPETYFAPNGYPQLRFYVINSGDGYLYNMRVPFILDNNLELYEVDNVSLPPGAEMKDTNEISEQMFEFNNLKPGGAIYVDFTLRMTGCEDLNVKIEGANWWCDSNATECKMGDDKHAGSVIKMSSSDVIVTKHFSEPSIIDYCNNILLFTFQVENLGTTEVYEIIAEEYLPPGLTLLTDWTPQYKIENGKDDIDWTDFPTPDGYTAYDAGVISWNFMDVDGNGEEGDSLITTTDDHESDNDGLRHFVFKPKAKISIRYKAYFIDCKACADYANSDKRIRARIRYDKPCEHHNPGEPLSISPFNVLFTPPGTSNIDIYKVGQNPKPGWHDYDGDDWTPNIVHALPGDTVNWRITLTSNGTVGAPEVILKDILPTNLIYSKEYSTVNDPNFSSPGIGISMVEGNGTTSDPLVFYIKNNNRVDDPLTPDVDESTYLDKGEQITVQFKTTVSDCADLQTNVATVSWGCCPNDLPNTTSGEKGSATDIITRPLTDPIINIEEKGGYGFTGCRGALMVTILNPYKDFEYYNFNFSLPLPEGYIYDDSRPVIGGTEFTFSGDSSGQRIFNMLNDKEDEPLIDGNLLYWRAQLHDGNIPDYKAKLFPNETIRMDVYFKTKGTACDIGPLNDGSDPYDVGVIDSFTALFKTEFDDNCINTVYKPFKTLKVDPEQADIDITKLSANKILARPGEIIQWEFTITNLGDIPASDIEMKLALGNGYNGSTIAHISGEPPHSTINTSTNTVTWNRGLITLNVAGGQNSSRTWKYQAIIKQADPNSLVIGDLFAIVDVDGFCLDLANNNICQYTDDQKRGDIAGAEIKKSIIHIESPGSATSTSTGSATIGNIITHQVEIYFYNSGAYSNIRLTDVLPAGMQLISTRYIYGTGSFPGFPSAGGGSYTWHPGYGVVDSATHFTIEIKTRVMDVATNFSNKNLLNSAVLSFNAFGYTYDSSTHPSYLQKQNSITIIEPQIIDDEDYIKRTISPPAGSNVKGGDTIQYEFTARNTGKSPAYEVEFVDYLPMDMRSASPVINSIRIKDIQQVYVNLVEGEDYNYQYDPNGIINIKLLATPDATLDPNDKIFIDYAAFVENSVGIGRGLENSAGINSFTSLFDIDQNERTYPLEPITRQLVTHLTDMPYMRKSIQTTLTGDTSVEIDSNTPLAVATCDEEIIYRLRYYIPENTTVYDLRFSDTIPDGLTVNRVLFTYDDSNSRMSVIPSEVNGTTIFKDIDVLINGTNDLPYISMTGEAVVVEIYCTVDPRYNSGANVSAGDIFNNTGGFKWNAVNDVPSSEKGPAQDSEGFSISEPDITKVADPPANSFVQIDDKIIYTLIAPNPVVGFSLYDVNVIDTLPDGLEIVDPRINELNAGDIRVSGGKGIYISVDGPRSRVIHITASGIDRDDGDSNDEPDVPGGDADSDQMIITIIATVRSTFDNGVTISPFHEFRNTATLKWRTRLKGDKYSKQTQETVHMLQSRGMIFQPDNTGTAIRGSVKAYRHVIINLEGADDAIVLEYDTSSQRFPWVLYLGDGNGNITGPPIESNGSVIVPGNGGIQEIIVRSLIPVGTPPYTTDILQITATGSRNSGTVTDITTIQDVSMIIKKEVSLDNVTYYTSLDGKGGSEVYCRISFYDSGTEPVKNVKIYDAIPEFTEYVRGYSTDNSELKLFYSLDGGVNWHAGEPATDAIAEQVKALLWEYIGNGGILYPGETKQIIFKIRIE